MNCSDRCILGLHDVLPLVGAHTRPLVEGNAVLQKGILSVGKIECRDDYLEVFALVIQCSHSAELPHGVTIKISLSDDGDKRLKLSCSCIAGKGGQCKHSIAVCLRLTSLRVTDLESFSCTDMKQRWGKPQMKAHSEKEFSGVPLAEQCHFQQRRLDSALSLTKDQTDACLRELLVGAGPDCELALFLSHQRFYEEISSSSVLCHKSVSKALKSVPTASTTLPKPKPQTKRQLKALREAKEKEAAAAKDLQEATLVQCALAEKEDAPAKDLEPDVNVAAEQLDTLQNDQDPVLNDFQTEGADEEDLREVQCMVEKAITSGSVMSKSESLAGYTNIRNRVTMITELLQEILPSINTSLEEGGKPLAQSTPKQPSTAGGAKTRHRPLGDRTNILQKILPNNSLEEGGQSLAQSTPKQPCTSGGAETKRRPLGDRTNMLNKNKIIRNQGENSPVEGQNEKENKSEASRLKTIALKEKYADNVKNRSTIPSFPTAPKDWVLKKFQSDISVDLGLSPPIISNEDDSILYQNRIAVSEEEAVTICMETTSQGDCPSWQLRRRLAFTGSKAYEIYRRKLSLDNSLGWDGVLRNRLRQLLSEGGSRRNIWTLDRGLKDEPYAKEAYELKTGYKVHNLGACIHPKIPHLLSSPDGVVVEQGIYVEIKSPELGINAPAEEIIFKLSYIYNDNGMPKLREKDPYYGQVQMAMAILSLKIAHLVIYSSFDNSVYIVTVPFNATFVKTFFSKLTDIYVRYNLRLLRELAV